VKTLEKFFSALFDPGELVCFSKNKYGTRVYYVSSYCPYFFGLFGINPCTYRKGIYVTAFRSFLIEFDDRSLKAQYDFAKEIGLPYTTIVYSGHRSLHFIISLATALLSIADYKETAIRLMRAVPGADKSTKDPCRFSRAPMALREDTGKVQGIVEIKERIPNDYFFQWLDSRAPAPAKKEVAAKKIYTKAFNERGTGETGKNIKLTQLPPFVYRRLLEDRESPDEGRNNFWHWIGHWCRKKGFDVEDAVDQLEYYFDEEGDFRRDEWKRAIENAYVYHTDN